MSSPHVHVPYDRIRQHLGLILENRLNLEIYFSSDMLDSVRPGDLRELAGLLSHRPAITFHAPYMDLSPAAMDSRILETTRLRFNQLLDIGEILTPLAVVVHSGYEKWKYSLKIEPWLSRSLTTWVPLNERAAALGIKIAVENIFEDEPANLLQLSEEVNSSNFGICFDTGHFNLFSIMPLDEWLDMIAPHIIEVHLHDNDRTADQHFPIGDGTFDFERLATLLEGRDYIRTLEAHSPERVLKSLERYRRLFD